MFFVSVPPVFIHRTNKRGTLLIAPKDAEGESAENIRVFGGFLRARGVFLEKNDGDRGVFPVFGKTLYCVETV